MKKTLTAAFILIMLYSCKKDKLSYTKLQGDWKAYKYTRTYFPPDTNKNSIDTTTKTNYEILNFDHDGSGESNYGLGGFTYSLQTLKFYYARTGYYEHWDMALIDDTTLTLTFDNIATASYKDVKYYHKIK